MFSVRQKREIADKVQKILRETEHPELPTGEIQFTLHVEGAETWSWAEIRNNGAVATPKVNPWNEAQDAPAEQPSICPCKVSSSGRVYRYHTPECQKAPPDPAPAQAEQPPNPRQEMVLGFIEEANRAAAPTLSAREWDTATCICEYEDCPKCRAANAKRETDKSDPGNWRACFEQLAKLVREGEMKLAADYIDYCEWLTKRATYRARAAKESAKPEKAFCCEGDRQAVHGPNCRLAKEK